MTAVTSTNCSYFPKPRFTPLRKGYTQCVLRKRKSKIHGVRIMCSGAIHVFYYILFILFISLKNYMNSPGNGFYKISDVLCRKTVSCHCNPLKKYKAFNKWCIFINAELIFRICFRLWSMLFSLNP